MASEIIEAKGMTKRFTGVLALDNVDFTLRRGEVRALMGKNGAGKSTLIKVFTGVYPADRGEMWFDGHKVENFSPYEMHRMGIGAIYQENDLIPYFTVGQTMFLNNERVRWRHFLESGRMHREAHDILLKHLDVDIDPYTLIDDLNVSQKQLVQIGKQLFHKSKVLVFDEPTAALSSTEIEKLFRIIKKLRDEGTSIIYISHRLEEVFHVSDAITVMRDGKKVADLRRSEISESDLIWHMTGETLKDDDFPPRNRDKGRPSMRLRKLKASGIDDLTIDLHEGEILGFFGAEGAGQENLSRILYGMMDHQAELFELNGKPVRIRRPKDAVALSIGCIPRDRKREGMIADFTVGENITIANLKKYSSRGVIKKKREREEAGRFIDRLAIKTPGAATIIRSLSGGNQQKAIIARWLTLDLQLLILDYPTAGIDVQAKKEVYRILRELADNGTSMILITPEYDEIKSLCDRVVVIREGRMRSVLPVAGLSEHSLLVHAIGSSSGEAGPDSSAGPEDAADR